jgi:hypothetical protein
MANLKFKENVFSLFSYFFSFLVPIAFVISILIQKLLFLTFYSLN